MLFNKRKREEKVCLMAANITTLTSVFLDQCNISHGVRGSCVGSSSESFPLVLSIIKKVDNENINLYSGSTLFKPKKVKDDLDTSMVVVFDIQQTHYDFSYGFRLVGFDPKHDDEIESIQLFSTFFKEPLSEWNKKDDPTCKTLWTDKEGFFSIIRPSNDGRVPLLHRMISFQNDRLIIKITMSRSCRLPSDYFWIEHLCYVTDPLTRAQIHNRETIDSTLFFGRNEEKRLVYDYKDKQC